MNRLESKSRKSQRALKLSKKIKESLTKQRNNLYLRKMKEMRNKRLKRKTNQRLKRVKRRGMRKLKSLLQ